MIVGFHECKKEGRRLGTNSLTWQFFWRIDTCKCLLRSLFIRSEDIVDECEVKMYCIVLRRGLILQSVWFLAHVRPARTTMPYWGHPWSITSISMIESKVLLATACAIRLECKSTHIGKNVRTRHVGIYAAESSRDSWHYCYLGRLVDITESDKLAPHHQSLLWDQAFQGEFIILQTQLSR